MSKKRKFIPEVRQEVGCFCCESERDTPWLYPFIGYIEKVYENSALVTIASTHLEDDKLIEMYDGQTIVPLVEMRATE